jgi:hypothetical protein
MPRLSRRQELLFDLYQLLRTDRDKLIFPQSLVGVLRKKTKLIRVNMMGSLWRNDISNGHPCLPVGAMLKLSGLVNVG